MNKTKGIKKLMLIALIIVMIFIAVIIIFFKIPYSNTKSEYQDSVREYYDKFNLKNDFFTKQDIAHLPAPVQNYFRTCGYLGKLKMASMEAFISDVPLKDSKDKPPMIVDYILCSFADEPIRLAYIKTSLYGIPFEGYDSFQNGSGFMKGIIGKVITIFNQTGIEMDKGQFVTYLAECFLIPSSLLNNYISWKPIDDTHAEATMTYKDMSVSGIFTFDKNGFVESFQTDDRAKISNDGTIQYVHWSMIYENYIENDGVYLPATIKTIWHDKDGDLIYFDADNVNIKYDNLIDITK